MLLYIIMKYTINSVAVMLLVYRGVALQWQMLNALLIFTSITIDTSFEYFIGRW